MPTISQLASDTVPNDNDLLVTVDVSAGTTKNITREDFFTGAPLPDGTLISHTYSTSEQVVGKWIDDKPIYGRVFTGTITHAGGERNFRNLVSNVDNIINASGWFMGSDSQKYYLGATAGNNNLASVYHFTYAYVDTGNSITVVTMSDGARTNSPYQYYIEYTKT